MPRIIERWLLFRYVGAEFTPLSKPLKKKEQAEKARLSIQSERQSMFSELTLHSDYADPNRDAATSLRDLCRIGWEPF